MSHVISTRGLTMHFPGCRALNGIDFEAPRGSVFALLGENGAGKTTLIRILTGFLLPTAGTCEVLGLDPTRRALEIRRRIGYVAEASVLYEWMRVDEIGWFAAAFYPFGFLDRYRDSVRRFDLSPDQKIRRLSKGQRAKVALALALASDPALLILDEPTSGLDPLSLPRFRASLESRVQGVSADDASVPKTAGLNHLRSKNDLFATWIRNESREPIKRMDEVVSPSRDCQRRRSRSRAGRCDPGHSRWTARLARERSSVIAIWAINDARRGDQDGRTGCQ